MKFRKSTVHRHHPEGVVYTVSFHNFKSQDFKSSVSNPKSKYVAYLSVLSRISNCQGLGLKNKHDIFKTDCRSCCLNSGTVAVSNINSRRRWCVESLFPHYFPQANSCEFDAIVLEGSIC